MNKIFGTFLAAAMLCASCSRNVFNEQDYIEIVEEAQPVKNIDLSHTWDLTTTYYITVDAGSRLSGLRSLQILDANPADGEVANILAEVPVSDGEKKYLAFTAPITATSFYAALVDTEGLYTLKAFTSADRAISFARPTATRVAVDGQQLSLQCFTYGFEDEMPEPGDYDYNDVVLRISQERTAENQVTLNVTLAAVGSLSQVAAAIRLVNYQYDDIESVTTTDGQTFDDGYRKSKVPFIDGTSLLLKGIDGASAVINVFEDAHWATEMTNYTSEGYLPRYKYNVSKTTSSQHDMMTPRTVSYVVTFRNPVLLDYFTLDLLDPFIIVEYNGIYMEAHAVYKYRSETVLHEYSQPTSATILPWGLTIPDGTFRYPLDGINIGFANDDATFGAYLTTGHAFGQWAANHTTATDWYQYPTINMVY